MGCCNTILFLFSVHVLRSHDEYLPTKLNVFVDTGGDAHGDYGVIPGTDEHERQAQAHTQERQSPAGDRKSHAWSNWEFPGTQLIYL